MIQWLGLCASTAGGTGLIPGWANRIPYAAQHSQKKKINFAKVMFKKKKREKNENINHSSQRQCSPPFPRSNSYCELNACLLDLFKVILYTPICTHNRALFQITAFFPKDGKAQGHT